mmetsp:Transcript_42484/g.70654  ORF Transcript_42484/g.70654 Transcript_42484/m.70654 type:complete len:293 (-) Transcript_42484:204-1082(-)|eukprot:CAMPEP_0119325142 /NCGR_PEP_ID=MMETSP1333-20130426/65069_1 /TAXON_ID=418940 /ORGANISM="Scyphosphaera apsteinii, Strain RCC1455" /LENGTH=292 /DNA_ID=CAMNT_0007333033 /DNA_START=87 /DNA_END=965 /DNA_ORIENTATION=-
MRLYCSFILLAVAASVKLRDGGPRLWVKRPGAGTTVELVNSLAEVCNDNSLDEAAMEAVLRGEEVSHEGWQCGAAEVYSSKDELSGDETTSTSHTQSEADEAASTVDKPTTPPLNKVIIQFGASTLAVQIMKRCKDLPHFLIGLRLVYYISVAVRLLAHALIGWHITSTNDESLVEKKQEDPLSSMLAGLTGKSKDPPTTVAAYDRAQLHSLRSSYQMGAVAVFLIHLQFKWNQTLIYSAISSLVDLFFHPLFQIHVLHRRATGALARPYASGAPDMGSLFKAAAAAKSAAQ